MPGVYISYPFCNQKCSFCNFASGVYKADQTAQYHRALSQEVVAHKWAWLPETIYFGGGTPSLMPLDLFRQLSSAMPARNLTEVTLECAPGTLTDERVKAWVEAGINRVSLGVQSFNTDELRYVGRRHDAEIVRRDLALLRDLGITNINLDLIAGLPHQTGASWADSLNWIERLDAPHVSVYLFEIDEDSRLGREVLLGGSRFSAGFVPSDDLAAEFYQTACARLAALGYQRYEISNFARPGWESHHNLKYWNREPYIGFGLDAHSFDGRFRWANSDDLSTYLHIREDVNWTAERQEVDNEEEHFFVGLRLMRGIEPSSAEWVRFAEPIEKWTRLGMLQRSGPALRLSPEGVLLSNEIFQEFLNV